MHERLSLLVVFAGCTAGGGVASECAVDDCIPEDEVGPPDTDPPDTDTPSEEVAAPPPHVVGIVLGDALLEMPGYGTMPNSVFAPVQLGHAHWMDGGSFVVTAAACHQYRENRGLWVFGEDGTAQGEANTCTDSLAEGEIDDDLSLWAHQWGSSNLLFQRIDATRFVVGGSSGSSHPYPPKVYEIGATPTMSQRLYALRVASTATSDPPEIYTQYEAPHVVGYAALGDRMIAAVDAGGRSNVLYSLPDLTELARTEQAIEPIGAAAGLVVTRRIEGGEFVSAFHRVEDDGTLTEVHRLPTPVAPQGVAIEPSVVADPLDASHVAVRSLDGVRELRVSEDALEELALHASTPGALALYGGSAVVGVCDEGVFATRCGLEVRTDGVSGARVNLPDEQIYGSTEHQPAGRPHSIAISPSGVGVVVTDYGAYRFELALE